MALKKHLKRVKKSVRGRRNPHTHYGESHRTRYGERLR